MLGAFSAKNSVKLYSSQKLALICLNLKFHKILFTGNLVMANLWSLNQGQ